MPLAPGFSAARSGNGNVVVQTLLAGDDAPVGPGGVQQTVNPAFSAKVAYCDGGSPVLELLDPSGAATDLAWFPVQRRFGPLSCDKIGLLVSGGGDPVLAVAFDGGVQLGPLDIELDELSVGVHLRRATQVGGYDVDLRGLAVSYASGDIALSGGLVKNTAGALVSYDGEALLKAGDYMLSAVGSYAALPGDGGASLFLFAWLDTPLGGPAFFFVTGLAAGFGYNRSLTIPTQDQVGSFPLVAAVSDAAAIGGDPSQSAKAPDPATVLGKLDAWVPPALRRDVVRRRPPVHQLRDRDVGRAARGGAGGDDRLSPCSASPR